eukprot:188250_1
MRPMCILKQFKTAGEFTTSLGRVPKQYHVNNSSALLIFGSINYTKAYDYINAISTNTHDTIYPIKYKNNRAPMVIWASEFFDSNHGGHNELNFSTYISRNNQCIEYDIDIDETPFHLFNTTTDAKTVASTPCAIYNNDPKVVAYNKEFLHLPAMLAKGEGLNVNGNDTTFDWLDNETNQTIIKGNVVQKNSFKDVYQLYQAVGFKGFWDSISSPYLHGIVINLDGLPADVYIQAPQKNTAVFAWDDTTGNIDIQHESVKEFEYKPLLCSHYTNMKFVYQPGEQDAKESTPSLSRGIPSYIGPDGWELTEAQKPYKTTKIFKKNSIPIGFTSRHNTKEGVTGLIHVVEGELELTIFANGKDIETDKILVIKKDQRAISAPQQWHQVAAKSDDVQFYVEFWKIP